MIFYSYITNSVSGLSSSSSSSSSSSNNNKDDDNLGSNSNSTTSDKASVCTTNNNISINNNDQPQKKQQTNKREKKRNIPRLLQLLAPYNKCGTNEGIGKPLTRRIGNKVYDANADNDVSSLYPSDYALPSSQANGKGDGPTNRKRRRDHSNDDKSFNDEDNNDYDDYSDYEDEKDEEDSEDDDDEKIAQRVYILDGVSFNNYQDFVDAKRKRNEKVLMGLGFEPSSSTPNKRFKVSNGLTLPSQRGLTSNKKKSSAKKAPPVRSRRSSRISGDKTKLVALDDEEDDEDDEDELLPRDSNQDKDSKSPVVRGNRRINNRGWDDKRWEKMFQRLFAYKKVHKHTRVPNQYDEDPPLGLWVSRQRFKYRNDDMPSNRLNLLNSIDFERGGHKRGNNLRNETWDDMFEKLVAYNKFHKHTKVPTRSGGEIKLGLWASKQRCKFKKNKLSKERRDKFEIFTLKKK